MTLWFPIHMQLSTATHIITHTHAPCNTMWFLSARSMVKNRNTHTFHAWREWLGQPCRTPDFSPHGLPFSSEAMGSVGPGAAPNLQARKERRGLPCRTPDHGLPLLFGGNGVCGTRSGTDLPPPSTQRHHACTDHSPLAIMVAGVEWLKGFLVKLPVETYTP